MWIGVWFVYSAGVAILNTPVELVIGKLRTPIPLSGEGGMLPTVCQELDEAAGQN
jgi:hypothetical protein